MEVFWHDSNFPRNFDVLNGMVLVLHHSFDMQINSYSR
jgi:hypothetical protein